jgi:hypothetical protein
MLKICLINVILSLIYSLISYKSMHKSWGIRIIFMVFTPFIGITMFLILDLMSLIKKVSIDMSHLEMIENSIKGKKGFVWSLDLQKEINKIPINDALAINSDKQKRKLVLDTLKGSYLENITFLKEALKDKDSETSHYAAAAIAELKRNLSNSFNKFSKEYKSDPSNIETAKDYAEILNQYIKSGLIDEHLENKYVELYSEVMSNIIDSGDYSESNFESKINCEIKLKKYKEVMEYCQIYNQKFPNNEYPYLMMMKILFLQGNSLEFYKVFDVFRNSSIVISNKTLNIFRFWLVGGHNERV